MPVNFSEDMVAQFHIYTMKCRGARCFTYFDRTICITLIIFHIILETQFIHIFFIIFPSSASYADVPRILHFLQALARNEIFCDTYKLIQTSFQTNFWGRKRK